MNIEEQWKGLEAALNENEKTDTRRAFYCGVICLLQEFGSLLDDETLSSLLTQARAVLVDETYDRSGCIRSKNELIEALKILNQTLMNPRLNPQQRFLLSGMSVALKWMAGEEEDSKGRTNTLVELIKGRQIKIIGNG